MTLAGLMSRWVTPFVGSHQRVGKRNGHVEQLKNRQSARRNEGVEILALDQLHGDEARALNFFYGVQRDNIRVIESRDRRGFALETGEAIG
jgi:hypothetical protein